MSTSPTTFEEAQRRLFGLGDSPNTSIETASDLGDEVVPRKSIETLWDSKVDDLKQDLKQHIDAQFEAHKQHIDAQLATGLKTLCSSVNRGPSRDDGGEGLTSSYFDTQLAALKKHFDSQLAVELKARSSAIQRRGSRGDTEGDSRSSGRDPLASARHVQHATGMAETQPLQKSSLENKAQDQSRRGFTASQTAVAKSDGSKTAQLVTKTQSLPLAPITVPNQNIGSSCREQTSISNMGKFGGSAGIQPKAPNELVERTLKQPTSVPKATPRPSLVQYLSNRTSFHGYFKDVPKTYIKDSSLAATAGAALGLIRSTSSPSRLDKNAAPGIVPSANTSSTIVASVAPDIMPFTSNSSRNDAGVAPKLTHPSLNSSSVNGIQEVFEAPAFATRLTSVGFPMPYHKADFNSLGSSSSKGIDQHQSQIPSILRKTAARSSVDEDGEDQIILSTSRKETTISRVQSSPVNNNEMEDRMQFSTRKRKIAPPETRLWSPDEDDDEDYLTRISSNTRKTVVPMRRSLRSRDKENKGHVSSRVRRTGIPMRRSLSTDDEDENGQSATKKQRTKIVTGSWVTIDIGYKSSNSKYFQANLKAAKLSDTLKELIQDEDINRKDHRRDNQEANWEGKQCWMAQYAASDYLVLSDKPYTITSPCGVCLQRWEEEGISECCYFGDKLNLLNVFRVDED